MNVSLPPSVLWAQCFSGGFHRQFSARFQSDSVSKRSDAPNQQVQVKALEGHLMHRDCLKRYFYQREEIDPFRFRIGKV